MIHRTFSKPINLLTSTTTRSLATSWWPFSKETSKYIDIYDRAMTPEELWWERNRVEVRGIYRDLLKITKIRMPRKLQREAKIAEFQFMFRECAKETDID